MHKINEPFKHTSCTIGRCPIFHFIAAIILSYVSDENAILKHQLSDRLIKLLDDRPSSSCYEYDARYF